MRILIADDTLPVRSAIRRLLNEESDLQVVGEAANLGELVRLAHVLQPDLILLDWELSGLPGSTKALSQPGSAAEKCDKRRNVIIVSFHRYQSHPQIIVLSGHPEVERSSLAAGADFFVFKGGPPEQLLHAIRGLATWPKV